MPTAQRRDAVAQDLPIWAQIVLIALAVVVGLGLLYLIGPFLWRLLTTVVLAVWIFIVGAFSIAYSTLLVIAGVAISVFCAVVATVFVASIALWGFGSLGRKLTAELRELRAEMKDEARRAARDATFIALLGVLSAMIAYMATDDFIQKLSTIRVLAASSIGYCAAKLFLLLPDRIAKLGGLLLTLVILTGSAMFLNERFDLVRDAATGFERLRAVLQSADRIKLTILATIAVLSGLSLLYPFTWTEWKRLLRVEKNVGSQEKSGSETI